MVQSKLNKDIFYLHFIIPIEKYPLNHKFKGKL